MKTRMEKKWTEISVYDYTYNVSVPYRLTLFPRDRCIILIYSKSRHFKSGQEERDALQCQEWEDIHTKRIIRCSLKGSKRFPKRRDYISFSVADLRWLSRIRVFQSRIKDLAVDKIPDPDPHQRIKVILAQKTDTKFSKISSRMFIPDPGSGFFSPPGSGFFPSRILGPKKPDPVSGSATLNLVWASTEQNGTIFHTMREQILEQKTCVRVSPQIVPINRLNFEHKPKYFT
jgi:hypothetical protein